MEGEPSVAEAAPMWDAETDFGEPQDHNHGFISGDAEGDSSTQMSSSNVDSQEPKLSVNILAARAEQKLLDALAIDRQFDAPNALKRTLVAGHSLDELHNLRQDPSVPLRREVLEEHTSITVMDQDTVKPKWERREFPKITEAYKKRKLHHDEKIHEFREEIIEGSEKLEAEVISLCRDLREDLEERDLEMDKRFSKLNDDSFLRSLEYTSVLNFWDNIEKLLQERGNSITAFAHQLETIEERRGGQVAAASHNLVAGLIHVSYILLPEIERLIESEVGKFPSMRFVQACTLNSIFKIIVV